MAETIVELAGCTDAEAVEALATHKEIWLAVDALLSSPKVSGDKYIPAKPKVDSGMTAEQEDRCLKGRDLQEQINVVFSVAHSKTRTLPALEELSASELPALQDVSVPEQVAQLE